MTDRLATDTHGDHPTPEATASETGDGRCTLCTVPTPTQPVTDSHLDGTFCCQGCLTIARTLESVEDVDETAVRERVDSTTAERAAALAGGTETFLSIDGMHCGTCEAFLEVRAEAIDGVLAAEASYATDAMRIVYDSDRLSADEVPSLLSGYGYEARKRGSAQESEDEDQALITFLIGGGLFGMMVMVWYAVFLYPTYFGYEPVVDFSGWDGQYLAVNIWLMTSFVLFYTGYPILRGAVISLRARMANMDLLVTTAALGSYAYSTLAMLLGRTDLYFDVTVAIVLAVTAGTYYEDRIKRRATSLLTDLTEEQVDQARLESGETVPLERVVAGDRILVRPGERVPLDGTVSDGRAALDESLVTGESVPVEKEAGDQVIGGSVVTDTPIVITVGSDATSTLDRLVSLLWTIQSARPGVQRLADKLATIFVPLVLVLASVATAIFLVLGASLPAALLVGLTVVIVSCPCALGLATPLAIASGVQAAASRGIVVATETIFEDARAVDTVVFDKTGTLTTGEMSVTNVITDDVDQELLVQRAATLEALSNHPIADAIVDASPEVARPDGGQPEPATAVTGFDRDDRGVGGVVDGERVTVGHPALLRSRGLVWPGSLQEAVATARADGDVPVAVGWDGHVRGVIVVGDTPRDDWEAVVAELSSDRTVYLLTGDDGAAAERFGAVEGVTDVFAGVPPQAKAETVRRLRERGTVAMVGDGSNDAPALAEADVGIAMGDGTTLATDAADAIIVSDDLSDVPEMVRLAAATHRRIYQNLGWAFVYNAIAIPIALMGILNPLLAALAMALSSLLVVLNSARSM